jgi:hypothetical protein
MIGDLRGRTVLLVAIPTPLANAFADAFIRHAAECVQTSLRDLDTALKKLHAEGRALSALICGDGDAAPAITSLDGYSAGALTHAINDRAWPAFACLQRTRAVLGRFPRYVIALSHQAPDRFAAGADFSAAGDAVIETLCRYANERLSAEDARMNILRYRLAPDDETGHTGNLFATPQEVASAAVALCSGLLDSMRGQVLTVDRGAGFSDNIFRHFEERSALGK